ncbi:reverse transcriptase domain-containing protein [Tanacetum coccineum]
MGKLVLALVHATRRLRRYFQAHPVVVITDQPIKQILSWSKNTRRMLKWKFELEAFDNTYRPRTSIRGQVLAKFIAERPDEEDPAMEAPAEDKNEKSLPLWKKEGYYWMTPLIEYLAKGTLPAETKKAWTIKIKARQYTMINGVLYRKSFLEPWLRYVNPIQTEYVVKEIHEGSCSMHSGPRSVVAKAIRSGYYWPTMYKDARNIIRKCDGCQTHRQVPKNPHQKLTPITPSWPFYKWGIDISGPFPEAQGKVRRNHIRQRKAVQRQLIQRLVQKAQYQAKVKEVPHVLWAHHTMIKTSNGDTSFYLTYDTKAVIPVKIGMPSLRCAEINQAENNKGLLLNLDMLEEKREKAAVCEARSKAKVEKYYNARVCSTTFHPGDFVYHNNEASHA